MINFWKGLKPVGDLKSKTMQVLIDPKGLDQLITVLKRQKYAVVGPTIKDNAIVYDNLSSTQDLPVGFTDEQDGGFYRLKKRKDASLFGFVVGPQSWKKYLFPPHLQLWRAEKNKDGFAFIKNDPKPVRYAFLGVRACELHAIAMQDKIFQQGDYKDSYYQNHREQLFLIAVNCTESGGTCFCTSMNSGPKADGGYDLALTEIVEDSHHYFVVETGSQKGKEVLQKIPHNKAQPQNIQAAQDKIEHAARTMKRTLNTEGLKELLYKNVEHPRWEQVANRCLTCANCTLVCPTCFCSTMEDVTDLTGDHAERWRKWDSCFTIEFSYIHGGSIRSTPKARYRQWMMHKLATWQDQFGTMGCVGCGRCITWCPVAIDLTEEARVIRESDSRR